jgi:hypothetical protein
LEYYKNSKIKVGDSKKNKFSSKICDTFEELNKDMNKTYPTNWETAFTENVPTQFIDLITTNITVAHQGLDYRKQEGWFYWLTNPELNRLVTLYDTLKKYNDPEVNHFRRELCDNPTGFIKMYQIADIINDNPDVKSKNIYFFDDAKHNIAAYNIWKEYDARFVNIKFVGGDGKCVFIDDHDRVKMLSSIYPKKKIVKSHK